MIKYNKKQLKAIKKSMKMWRWLSSNPDKIKNDYKIIDPNILNIYDRCYCCETFTIKDSKSRIVISCTTCPLVPDNQNFDSFYCCEEFYNWVRTSDQRTRKINAEIIYKKLKEACENESDE